jgi:hypothetical protein
LPSETIRFSPDFLQGHPLELRLFLEGIAAVS